jgi:hypothetical protein
MPKKPSEPNSNSDIGASRSAKPIGKISWPVQCFWVPRVREPGCGRGGRDEYTMYGTPASFWAADTPWFPQDGSMSRGMAIELSNEVPKLAQDNTSCTDLDLPFNAGSPRRLISDLWNGLAKVFLRPSSFNLKFLCTLWSSKFNCPGTSCHAIFEHYPGKNLWNTSIIQNEQLHPFPPCVGGCKHLLQPTQIPPDPNRPPQTIP